MKHHVEAKQKVAWWIRGFYNRLLLHLSMRMLSQVEFEQVLRDQHMLACARETELVLAA